MAVGAVTGPPLAFAAAVQSVILAVIAVGVSPPPSPSPRRVRRQEDWEVEAFAEEIEDADMDLVERVWNAPRPRVKRITGTDSGPGTAL